MSIPKMGKTHHVGGVLEACVATGVPLAGVHCIPRLHGGRAGDIRGTVAADYQADGREPGLHVQGHGRGVRANARAFCVWRGNHHDEHSRGGNHHLRHYAVCKAKMFYALALFNVFVAAVAQMLLKKAANTPHKSFIKEYLNPWVIGGYSLMAFSLESNVYVLS